MKTRCATLVSNTLEYAEVLEVVREAETERESEREREKEIEREMEIQSIREIRRVQTNQMTARQIEESKIGFLFTIGLWCSIKRALPQTSLLTCFSLYVKPDGPASSTQD